MLIDLREQRVVTTWWEFHLPEALDGCRDFVSVHQDVVLLPDAVVSGSRHVQDVARGLPATQDSSVVHWRLRPQLHVYGSFSKCTFCYMQTEISATQKDIFLNG